MHCLSPPFATSTSAHSFYTTISFRDMKNTSKPASSLVPVECVLAQTLDLLSDFDFDKNEFAHPDCSVLRMDGKTMQKILDVAP
jgi:hypothetical protein